jgi:hypothetical protein
VVPRPSPTIQLLQIVVKNAEGSGIRKHPSAKKVRSENAPSKLNLLVKKMALPSSPPVFSPVGELASPASPLYGRWYVEP